MRPADLSDAEGRVWEAFPRGARVDLRSGDQEVDAPEHGHRWGPERTIRAEVLAALLLGAGRAEAGHVARLVLTGARIAGPLDLSDAEIAVPVALSGCRFDENVSVANARTRRLELSDSWLARLDALQARIDGDLILRRSRVRGGVELAGAHIVGLLALDRARIGNPAGYALHAARLMIDHSIYCPGTVAEGGIVLTGARIGGGVHIRGARLTNHDGPALAISRATVDDDINLVDGCVVEGPLRLRQTHVRGQVNMSGAHLVNPGGPAVIADNLTVDQNMYCAQLNSEAEIRLLGAHIAGDLVLSGARLDNPGGEALDAGSLVVDRGVRCDDGFVAHGAIRLTGARIGVLELLPAEPVTGDVDLRHAQVGVLRDDPATCGRALHLDGFGYDTLEPLLSVQARLDWLGRQPDGYRPLPYEQLAATYRRLGHDADARRVLLAKQRRRRATLTPTATVWGLVQDWTVGYGYLPGRAAVWLLALFTVGTAFFWTHPPVRIQTGPQYNPLVYTLDVLLPVVNLGQEPAFTPVGTGEQWCTYLLVAAGWVLATAVATGITRTLTRG